MISDPLPKDISGGTNNIRQTCFRKGKGPPGSQDISLAHVADIQENLHTTHHEVLITAKSGLGQ